MSSTVVDPVVRSIHGRFARVASAAPHATALVSGSERLTYGELAAAAGRVAGYLRAAGVTRGEPVGIVVDRSPRLVVGLLGILSAGGAYVALDRRDSPDRLDRQLRDVGVRLLLTDDPDVAVRAPVRVVHIDRAGAADGSVDGPAAGPSTEVDGADDPDHLAYVAFTSGSSGRPKGVGVPHRAVCRLVLEPDFLDIRSTDVFLQYAPVAFDASTLELWGPLLNGAALVVAPSGNLAPAQLIDLVRSSGVTVLWLTAGLFHQVVDAGLDDLPRLRYLLAGGDVLSADHVGRARAALPAAVVINGYGPTENTTFTCCHPVGGPVGPGGVPIGRPIRGTGVRVLSASLDPVPDGVVGRLYATGDGLAHGYINQPGHTAERFVPDPYSDIPGTRMYDTGDLVLRRTDGVLEFRGRVDNQVKIQGFRVEPEEAEAVLATHPDIRTAVVVTQVYGTDDRRLAAFYESEVTVPSAELRRLLAEKLPPYLVPATFTPIDALPLTGNGKVDRAALAERRNRRRPDLSSPYRPPRTALETWLVEVWQEVTHIDRIGVDDDFFELGGHSLLATRITMEIGVALDVFISARTFYENPTVGELAERLAELTDLPVGRS